MRTTLLDNLSQYLLDFTGRLEEKEIVSAESGAKIRKYIRAEESPARWEIFLIFGALLGAISFSAGVYAITSHNWYDIPVFIRNIFSFIPVGVGLYFYYRMLRYHPHSRAWVEASSLFLMLMIGASIAIASQTYHMSSDFSGFLKVMLLFTIPLFYIKRASFIAFFYLILATVLLFLDVRTNMSVTDPIDFGTSSYWYWLFIFALLPHFYMSLDRKSNEQGLRVMFLTFIMYGFLYYAIMASVDSNRLLWLLTYNVAFYMFAKRYMGGHFFLWTRFMSWLPQISVATTLLFLSNKYVLGLSFGYDSIFKMDDWEAGGWFSFILLVVVLAGLYYNYFKEKTHYENSNQLILLAPIFVFLLMCIVEYIDTWWFTSIIVNLYILGLAVVIMVNGSEEGRFAKIFAGLVLLAILFTTRYFDMTVGFIFKGLLFMFFGGVFFMINMFVKEKVDQINRFKNR